MFAIIKPKRRRSRYFSRLLQPFFKSCNIYHLRLLFLQLKNPIEIYTTYTFYHLFINISLLFINLSPIYLAKPRRKTAKNTSISKENIILNIFNINHKREDLNNINQSFCMMGYKTNQVDGIIFGTVVLGVVFFVIFKLNYVSIILILIALVVSIFRRNVYKILS